jgi:hypothetical protein
MVDLHKMKISYILNPLPAVDTTTPPNPANSQAHVDTSASNVCMIPGQTTSRARAARVNARRRDADAAHATLYHYGLLEYDLYEALLGLKGNKRITKRQWLARRALRRIRELGTPIRYDLGPLIARPRPQSRREQQEWENGYAWDIGPPPRMWCWDVVALYITKEQWTM